MSPKSMRERVVKQLRAALKIMKLPETHVTMRLASEAGLTLSAAGLPVTPKAIAEVAALNGAGIARELAPLLLRKFRARASP